MKKTKVYINIPAQAIAGIGTSIRNCFENFESVIDEFSIYRSSIKNQTEQLHNLVKQYFI